MSAKVFDELICPECGGRIGADADGTASPGVKPCTCFEPKPERRQRPDEPDPLDMVPLTPAGAKLCRVCQRDLTGRARLKDDKGYICKKCSDKEFEAEAEAEADSIECPECHRKLKADAFLEFRGTLICRRCQADHIENDRLKVAKLGELRLHAKEEKKSVLILAIVGGVLAIALVVKNFIIGW